MSTLHLSHPTLTLEKAEQTFAELGIAGHTSQIAKGHFSRATDDQTESSIKANPHHKALASQIDIALIDQTFKATDIRVLAMDMDSTLITIECIDEIADFIGKKSEVSAITEAAMRGEIKDFSESLNRRVALLKGVPESALQAVYEERLQLSPGAEALIAFAKNSGWATLLVSGGFTFFTEKLKARLGLDLTHANTLEVVDGYLTGRVLGPIVDGNYKKQAVSDLCNRIGCPTSSAICMGDGANDLPMMSIAGASVAYRAKPTVQAQTRFQINHGGLDTVANWLA